LLPSEINYCVALSRFANLDYSSYIGNQTHKDNEEMNTHYACFTASLNTSLSH